ncbi:MAG: imidazoleglycerol-phosphate dehydratase HisB [Candidatus Caenarcaniphilales bacterium]|nr:imidazoleglycerol-phosphate dehydratase HisB [Candidatus Caenarcaniphilales bacterium]
MSKKHRLSHKLRETKETRIEIKLNLDEYTGTKIVTESPFFSHMLEQFSKHGLFGLEISAEGDYEIDDHHVIEDAGIVLGQAFCEALGERKQLTRYGSARVPMDETLIEADVDLTTRPFLVYEVNPGREWIGQFDTCLPLEFWRAFVNNCGLNLHISQIRGGNAHHIIEGSFKAVTLALRKACSIDPKQPSGSTNSTKGIL